MMTRETINARFVASGGRLAMASPVRALSALKRAIFGRVATTDRKRRQGAMLLSQREIIRSQIETARRQRKSTKQLTSQAYSITHEILARGRK